MVAKAVGGKDCVVWDIGMKWTKNNKNKIFDIIREKSKDLSYNDWNARVDKLGIKRMTRQQYGKLRKLYLEDTGDLLERDKNSIQISNPWWHGYQNSGSKHLISIPKTLAEKVIILGDIPIGE